MADTEVMEEGDRLTYTKHLPTNANIAAMGERVKYIRCAPVPLWGSYNYLVGRAIYRADRMADFGENLSSGRATIYRQRDSRVHINNEERRIIP
jgi:hypothetical protein